MKVLSRRNLIISDTFSIVEDAFHSLIGIFGHADSPSDLLSASRVRGDNCAQVVEGGDLCDIFETELEWGGGSDLEMVITFVFFALIESPKRLLVVTTASKSL